MDDNQLAQLILDLDQKQPAKKTLIAGSTEYVNKYPTKQLLRLFRVLLARLMPEQAVTCFGLFLGAMNASAVDKIAVFYGYEVERWLNFGNACKWNQLFKTRGGG